MAKAKKRKEKKTVYEGNVYIQATFNNTIVTITDLKGNAVSWASAGGLGFRGAKSQTVCSADYGRNSSPEGNGQWAKRSECICKRPWSRTRIGDTVSGCSGIKG